MHKSAESKRHVLEMLGDEPLLTAAELAALRSLPEVGQEARDPVTVERPTAMGKSEVPVDPVGYWRRQAEVEASHARDTRQQVRQLRKEMAREERRAFQFGWALVLTWCVIIAMAWTGAV